METVGIDVVAETKTNAGHSGGKPDTRFASPDQYQLLNAGENKPAGTSATGVIDSKATDGMSVSTSRHISLPYPGGNRKPPNPGVKQ